jgi:hypothetical protein
MNFAITWLFDKLGYMPKIDMQVGKINIDTESPEFKMWPFPVKKPKKQVKKPTVKKTVPKKKPLETKFTVGKPKAVKKANKRLEKIEK